MAVAHALLVVIYHMLLRQEAYRELGENYFEERDRQAVERRAVRQLEGMGYTVILQPKAAA